MEVFRELPSSAELSAFCKQDASTRQFSDELRSILEVSAMTGLYWHRWDELRTLLLFRLKQVLQDFYKSHMDVAVGPPRPLVTGESYQELEDRLASGLESFTDGAPFTIQRFCEVLLNPRDRYPNLDKVALAFEKLLLVTSTIPPSPGPYPGIASVPAPTPAKDADQIPQASPKRENVESSADIIISESKDVLVPAENIESSADIIISESKDVLVAAENVESSADITISESKDVLVAAENVESSADIIISESKDVLVAADEHMADAESTEAKEERSMDVDAPQPSETIIAAEQSAEQPSAEVSAAKDEGQPVDTLAEPPADTSAPVPMVDDDEPKGDDVTESST